MSWEGPGIAYRIEGPIVKKLSIQILDEEPQQSMEYYGLKVVNIIVEHDHDPKYTSKMASKWLSDHVYLVMTCPEQSAGLNPIEYLWKHIKDRLRELKIHKNWSWSCGRGWRRGGVEFNI